MSMRGTSPFVSARVKAEEGLRRDILKVKDGERNFDLLGAKRTFDAYVPGEAPLKLKGRQAETEKEPPAREGSEQRDSRAHHDAFGSFGVD